MNIGGILLAMQGAVSQGVLCTSEDILYLLGNFCGGSVYRYFDRMKNGFVVDDYGWRMGIITLPEKSRIAVIPDGVSIIAQRA